MNKSKFTFLSLLFSLIAVVGVAATGYFLAPQYFLENDLAPTMFGIAGAIALVLWGGLQLIVPKAETPRDEAAKPAAKAKTEPQLPVFASAVQLLSILQRQGRFLDFFIKEDLSQYDDAQIGAAVRNVHEGCKKALTEYFTIEPVMDSAEGSEVTISKGFNANQIRLVGNVTGDPPFKGSLMHHGWRVKNVRLPKIMKTDEKEMILSAAEVEVM